MNPAAERKKLVLALRQSADAEYKTGAAAVMKTELDLHGVRVPVMRQIARDFQRAHRGAPWEQVLEVVEALWDGASQEERTLAILILGYSGRKVPELEWAHFDRWRRKLGNWGLTDALGVIVLGPWIEADMEARLGVLEELIKDEDLWSRRLALVATAPINRGHKGITIPDLTLRLVDKVKSERHPMITKAVSWALRELTKMHQAHVTSYLKKNRATLAPLVVREVENKLRTGLKSGKAASSPE
jgi:3-methyladenine DNA glycosylase AlkD